MQRVQAISRTRLGSPRHSLVEIVEYDPPDFLVIRDIGPWHEAMTVTNNVEAVVADLFAQKWLRADQLLYYFDSEGVFDQIEHDGQRFVRFLVGDESVLPGQSITGAQAPLAFATADQEFPDVSSGSDQELGASEDREDASLHSKAAG